MDNMTPPLKMTEQERAALLRVLIVMDQVSRVRFHDILQMKGVSDGLVNIALEYQQIDWRELCARVKQSIDIKA